MSLVASNDVEAGKVYELVEAQGVRKEKISPDMTWVNVNFKAKSKNILTNCWGNVRYVCSHFFLLSIFS